MYRVLALAFCIYGSTSNAGEERLQPLLEALPNATSGYPFVRCVALYQTAYDWAESKNGALSEAQHDRAVESLGFHIMMAHLVRGYDLAQLENGTDPRIQHDIDLIALQYSSLFEENYINKGRAAAGMVAEDLQVCKTLEEEAQ